MSKETKMGESVTSSEADKENAITKGKGHTEGLTRRATIFLVITPIVLALLIHYYIKHDGIESADSTKTCVLPDSRKVCITPDCVLAAAMMTKKMNMTADPCVDFYEYACGGFNAEVDIPEGESEIGTLSILNNKNTLLMKKIITQKIRPEEPQYLQNMKRFYKSCMDEATIEKIGLAPYFEEKEFVHDWPTLNADWNESTFNLNDVIARYETVFTEPLFGAGTLPNFFTNSRGSILVLTHPVMAQSNQDLKDTFFSRQRNDSVIMSYETYLAETAVALGANRSTAEKDAKEFVDLRIALSKIKVKEDGDLRKCNNPVTLGQLSTLYPDIDFARAIRAPFAVVNITLPDDQIVINMYPAYIGNLSLVINKFSARTLQNYFGFHYALGKVGGLTKRLRKLKLDIHKHEEDPRWQTCLNKASNVFSFGMGKQFVIRMSSEQTINYIDEMVVNLKTVFRDMLEKDTWMSHKTQAVALKKLAAMTWQTAYPAGDFTEMDIEKKYEHHIMSKDKYYANVQLVARLRHLSDLTTLHNPVNRYQWSSPIVETNAVYELFWNDMKFHAGILQSPVFSRTFQDSMNYAGIGFIIGHEIAHGFDNQGSMYDETGTLRNWWSESDWSVFLKRAQCLVDQYSSFHVDELNMTVWAYKRMGTKIDYAARVCGVPETDKIPILLNGENSLGEAIGDNVGLKYSYRAYKKYVQKHGEQPALPGLERTQDQLFFLAFGQTWCEKMTRATLEVHVTQDPHPPGRYRILGALQNSEEFAKAYNCARGSYINPEKKCSVW